MTKYPENTINDFIKDLSSRKHVPGGGSASALSAAIGAALNLMVLEYSRKEGNEDARNAVAAVLIERQRQILDELIKLVDEDCEAFSSLMKTLSSGGDLQRGYEIAAQPPMRTCRSCVGTLEVACSLLEIANPNLVSDLGCVVDIVMGAFRAASRNVEVNLAPMEDTERSSSMERSLEEMRVQAKDLSDKAYAGLTNK